MRDYEMTRLREEVNKICASGVCSGKKVFLFGAGEFSRAISGMMTEKGQSVVAIIDNDKTKQGGFCGGLRVVSFDEAMEQKDDAYYVVCSDFWKEMIKQLDNSGVTKRDIFVIKKTKDTLIEKMFDAIHGKKYYDKLIRRYGCEKLFLCPYTGTGDIYLIGAFWAQYVEAYNIKDYVFIVPSRACYRVAKLFPIENIVLVDSMKDIKHLIAYYLLKKCRLDMTILNDGWRELPYSKTEWLRGFKGLYFTQLFRKFVFELTDDIKPQHPKIDNYDDEVLGVFREYDLKPGKTVVLSPYSNTLLDLPDDFWVSMANDLQDMGYTVCTNSVGDAEPPVEGTKGVFVKLDLAPQFVEYAGFFIGVRSGFCDVVSGTTAKKVVLYYDKNRFYGTSAFSYFNLKDMELCDDAMEIKFTEDNMYDMISEIKEWL